MNKACSKCKITQSLKNFWPRKVPSGNLVLSSHCKRCNKNARKLWARENRDKIKQYSAIQRLNTPSEVEAKRCREKRALNPDVYKNITKRYRDKYPEKQIEKLARRRAQKKKAEPKWLTKKQRAEITDIYKQAKELEKIFFNRKFHVDHIIPLQGKNVCGLHVPWNLQILTAEENLRKNNNYE